MTNVKYDMSAEQIALIYNICDGIVSALNEEPKYIEDENNYHMAVDVILGIDTHGDAYQPFKDELTFIRNITGAYAEAVHEQHSVAVHLEEKAIALDEYVLASSLCRQLNQPYTIH